MNQVGHAFFAAFHSGAWSNAPRYGLLRVAGPDWLDLFHRLSTNSLLHLTAGIGEKTLFVTEKGRIVDLATVGVFDEYGLVLSARADGDRLAAWVRKFVVTENIKLTGLFLSSIRHYTIWSDGNSINASQNQPSRSREEARISTGAAGNLRWIFDRTGPLNLCSVIDEDVSAGAAEERFPLLAGERPFPALDREEEETLRIALGLPGGGTEISDRFTPFDVGLGSFVSSSKGCYVGQEVLGRMETYGKVRREIVGIEITNFDEGLENNALLFKEKAQVGLCTSLSNLLVKGSRIGLSVVEKGTVSPGERVMVRSGNSVGEGFTRALPMRFEE